VTSPATSSTGVQAPSLVERYAHMAHTFERRRVDRILRVLDVILGTVLLLLAAPVVGLAAMAVKASDRGPAFYRGRRVGRAGLIFTMYKLRTLRADAETRLGPFLGAELTFRTSAEHTAVGRILRATKVDELPQLYNVVRGEMSLVGPRPIRPAFFEQLCYEIPQYWQRLVVRPGMTGPAQLRLTREMTWAEKLAHDFEYIADRSVSLYLRILRDTLWYLLRGPWNR
jgi:lipopolysaccharide/colanic/teichoic acid biosynthesis glycosyltransferase